MNSSSKPLWMIFSNLFTVAKVRWLSQMELDAMTAAAEMVFGEMASVTILEFISYEGSDDWTFEVDKAKECLMLLQLDAEDDSLFMQHWSQELGSDWNPSLAAMVA